MATGLLLAGLPAEARGTVVDPHVVTPQVVAPHLVEPAAPAPAPPPAANLEPAPRPVEHAPSSGGPEPVGAPVAGPPRPQAPSPRERSGDGAPPRRHSSEGGHSRWAWLSPLDPNPIGNLWIMVPWHVGDPFPLFGFGPDLPLPGDGHKQSPVAGILEIESILLQDEVNRDLRGPHKAVTDTGGQDYPVDGGDDGAFDGLDSDADQEDGAKKGSGNRDLEDPAYDAE